MNNFTHLHCHSYYSLLDGLSSPEEIVIRAKELGQKAICITDHASISALPDFFKYGKEHAIKTIIGIEFYIVHDDDEFLGKKQESRYHFIALARNWAGVQCLFRKLTLANQQKFNGKPRLLYSQLMDFNDCFVSLACAISLMIRDDYEKICMDMVKSYGNYFYLELIHASFKMKDKRTKKEIEKDPIDLPDQAKLVNLRCIEMYRKHNIPLVATHDAHFATKDQAKAFELLLCIQTRSKMTTPREKRFFFGDDDIYIKSKKEMFLVLQDLKYIDNDIIDMSIKNTNKVADMCNIEMPEFTLNLPKPYDGDDYEIFKKKIIDGFHKLCFDKKHNAKEYRDRISHEVNIITKLKLVRYFLIVEDLMRFCNENDIGVGSARGSAGSSLVALCMGITRKIDPIKSKLIFSRFLGLERKSMADIDLDISSEKRYMAIDYLREKYGKDNVAQVATYGFLSCKSAFRDVCSCYGFPSAQTNMLSKLINSGVIKENGKIIETYGKSESFDHVVELIEFKKQYPELINLVKILDGRVRNGGVHASAVITSSVPLSDLCAIESRKGGECICFDKVFSENVQKLLKIDCLGLSTCHVNSEACALISDKNKTNFTTNDIPLDDKKTKEMLASGDTVGIFQFEGNNARRLLKDGGSGTIEVCSAISAVNRPGALNAKLGDGKNITTHYIKRLNGSEPVEHFIPQFKPILSETFSLMIYQENMMKICTDIAGFSDGHADMLRKITAKKLGKDVLETHRREFVDGCISHSKITIKQANEIFDQILEMAGYGFCKAHAYAYAILSHESCYLKANYTVEFYCALLSYANKADLLPIYVRDAANHNVKINYPDINLSDSKKYKIINGEIIAPLNCIKNVGDKAADLLVDTRNKVPECRFNSHEEFINTLTSLSLNGRLNKRIKDSLYRAGAFRSIGYYEKDVATDRENLRELLSLFNTTPILNLKYGRGFDKEEYKLLDEAMRKCNKEDKHGGFVEDVIPAAPSVVCILDLSKQSIKILQGVEWIHKHLAARLGISKSKIAFVSARKCSWYNVDKKDISSECKTMCSREFVHRQLEILKPKLVINFTGYLTSWISDSPGLKFSESFGNIYWNGSTEKGFYAINAHGPAWINFSDDAKQDYEKNIIPLLESLKGDK